MGRAVTFAGGFYDGLQLDLGFDPSTVGTDDALYFALGSSEVCQERARSLGSVPTTPEVVSPLFKRGAASSPPDGCRWEVYIPCRDGVWRTARLAFGSC